MKKTPLFTVLFCAFFGLSIAWGAELPVIAIQNPSIPEGTLSEFSFNDYEWEWTGESVVKSSLSSPETVEKFPIPEDSIKASAACPIGQSHLLIATSAEDSSQLWAFNMVSMEWRSLGGIPFTLESPVLFVEQGNPVVVPDRNEPATGFQIIINQEKKGLHLVDYTVICLYFLIIIYIGLRFARGNKMSSEDFFVGNRKMPTWAVGLSLYATGTSAISMMAIPAKAYATNWLYFTKPLISVFMFALIAIFMVPLIRRLNITSVYEYLELRFNGTVRQLGSATGIVLQLVARMGITLYLPALALSAVSGVPLVLSIVIMGIISTVYTVLGGIKAVIWTDVFQVVILLGGGLLSLIVVVTKLDGGFGEFMQIGMADDKFRLMDFDLNLVHATVWVLLMFQLTEGATWVKDQTMMQRVLSTKDDASAGRSIWVLNLIILPASLLFFSLGTALYVFYKAFPAKLDMGLSLDATFPFFVVHELPIGISGLIVAALFAASMSSLDSSMNSVATLFVVDFYKRMKKKATEAACMKLAHYITILAGVIGTGMALILSSFNIASLWDTFLMLVGIISGAFGGVFMLGLFTRRGNSTGALVGCISGVIITIFVSMFTNIHFFLFLTVGAFSCHGIGYLVSLMTGGNQQDVEGLTFLERRKRQRAAAT